MLLNDVIFDSVAIHMVGASTLELQKKNTAPKFHYVLLNTHASTIVPNDRQIGTFYVNWCWRLKIFIPQLVSNVMVNGMSFFLRSGCPAILFISRISRR